jgi:ankyrin repeat protein
MHQPSCCRICGPSAFVHGGFVKRIPVRPDPDHLKKQAKQLLADSRRGDPAAFERIRRHLPAAAGKSDAALSAMALRLHDAQSCLAREYGFPSWGDLTGFVAARLAQAADPARARLSWYALAYPGDVAGGTQRAQPATAARLLALRPGWLDDDPWLACAVGDDARLRRAIAEDPSWIHRAGGPLALPPLVAVTHSSLLRLAPFRDRLHACARLLLEAGADPNQRIGSRWPPASLQAPAVEDPLSALYGAAGQHHDAGLTQLLLRAGADPNDGESLYHALESAACTRLLLEAGARVVGTNALYRALDLDDAEILRLLLAHGADPNEAAPAGAPVSAWGRPLLWAIRRRRSPAHVEALLQAGADPAARTPDGTDAATLALRYGLPEVAALLVRAGVTPQDTPAERFLAACARGDEAEARRLQALHPEWPRALPDARLQLLPELAAQGHGEAVACMVRLGWPVAVRGGDWSASALNHAVFRGDAAMTRLLLAHGARWTERHAHGDDCSGTLSWASANRPDVPGSGGDWLGCAQALVEHGMPAARPDPQDAESVLIGGRRKRFSEEVTEFLLEAGSRR